MGTICQFAVKLTPLCLCQPCLRSQPRPYLDQLLLALAFIRNRLVWKSIFLRNIQKNYKPKQGLWPSWNEAENWSLKTILKPILYCLFLPENTCRSSDETKVRGPRRHQHPRNLCFDLLHYPHLALVLQTAAFHAR